jgi:iron complex outermembrane receptor protein
MLMLLLCLQDPAPAPAPVKKDDDKKDDKEVVVIGQRRESDVLDVPSGVTVITAEEIKQSGATNIVEVIQKQTGFFSSGAVKGAQDQTLDLRGYNNGAGNGQRTLVLVDGRKTNDVASTSTDFAAIPLDNIERIEITRGPAAALYGDSALAGVVNVITKKGGRQTVVTTTASAGTWNTFNGSAGVSGPANGGFYDVFASGSTTTGYRDHSDYSGGDFTGRFDLPVTDDLTSYIKAGYHGDSRQRPGSLSQAEIDTLGRRASALDGSPSEFRGTKEYIDLGATQSLGDLGKVSAFFNYSWTQGDSDFHSTFGDFFILDRSGIAMFQLKHVGTWKIFGRDATFTTGADFGYETADSRSTFDLTVPTNESFYRRRMIGAYENVEYRPIDQLILSGGARYDRALNDLDTTPGGGAGGGTSNFKAFDQISPMAGVTVRPVEEVSVYASYGRPFKYPTRDELIGFTASAPDLLPERSTSYEAGIRASAPKWVSGSVTLYRMIVKNEIYFDPTFAVPPFGFGTNVNVPEVTHQGVESEIRVTPCSFFEVFATHTYTRAVITEDQNPANVGNKYPVTPRLMGMVGATVKYEGVTFTLLGHYVGERLLVGDFDNTQPPLPAYWVMDTKISYTWKMVTAFFSVYNLANREYIDNGGVSFTGNRYNPGPARSWLLGGEVRF